MAKKKVIKKAGKKGDYKVGKGKPPVEYNIKKGQVLNPTGVNISPERRALKQLTEGELTECIKKVFTSTEDECLELINDPKTTLGHKVVLRAAVDAAEHGNYTKFNEILERVIGKVAQKIDMTTKGQALSLNAEDAAKLKAIAKTVDDEY